MVDDGSTDDSLAGATEDERVIRLDQGPRGRRRHGTERRRRPGGRCSSSSTRTWPSTPGTLGAIAGIMGREPDLDALFGSYDAAPPAPGLASRYKNLLHHLTHQRSGGDAHTFFTGCGAVRTATFRALGGFDEDLRLVEGHRVRDAPPIGGRSHPVVPRSAGDPPQAVDAPLALEDRHLRPCASLGSTARVPRPAARSPQRGSPKSGIGRGCVAAAAGHGVGALLADCGHRGHGGGPRLFLVGQAPELGGLIASVGPCSRWRRCLCTGSTSCTPAPLLDTSPSRQGEVGFGRADPSSTRVTLRTTEPSPPH